MSDFDYSYKAANAIMESFENLKKLELDIEADHVNKSFKSTQTELQNLNKILQNDPFEALNNINQLNATIQEKLNQKNMYGQNYVIREDHTRKYLENTSNVLNSLSSSITKAQNFKDVKPFLNRPKNNVEINQENLKMDFAIFIIKKVDLYSIYHINI